MKASSEFFDYTILSTSTEDSEYPASNLKVYNSSTSAFRTTAITEQTIVIDLLAAKSVPHIILYNVNFTQLTIEGNSSDSWGTPAFEEDYTIEKDPELQIYKIKIELTGFNYRYLRIVIPAQTPTDGAAYFEIGVAGIFESLETFEDGNGGFGFPLDAEIIFPEQINRYETGRKDVIPLASHPVMQLRLSGSAVNTETLRNKISNVFGRVGSNTIMIDRTIDHSWQCYIVQRTGSMTVSELKSGSTGARRNAIALETIL